MEQEATSQDIGTRTVAGVKVGVWSAGAGRPVLFLHGGDGMHETPFLRQLARKHRVIAPSHPGFDHSELPPNFRSVDDLAYFYLDFLKEQQLDDVVLVGVSFGAWIAAGIGIKSTERIAGLALIGALGARFETDPQVREIADLFSVPLYEQDRLLYHDEARRQQTYAHLSDEQALLRARNHESFCLYGWSPTLHDPKLAQRLHRIDVPTLLVWGSEDAVVAPTYGRRFADAMPNAAFDVVKGAGHYVHVEQPDRTLDVVDGFIGSLGAAEASNRKGRP
jgi:pimeloyl-ACP methyl ester carboxylesterase